MQQDIREAKQYREAEALHRALRQPGTGQISEAAEIHVLPHGRQAVFAATMVDKLAGVPPTRICRIDLASGQTTVLTFGPNTDRLPKYSPNGAHIAFLSDRHGAGDFQLHLLHPVSGAVSSTPAVNGWVEYLQWSPDGKRILLGVTGHGSDVAGIQGAVTGKPAAREVLSWMPAVETADESHRWRRAWVYDLATDSVRQASTNDMNIWEAAWCGNDSIAAVASPGPGEGLWFSARLHIIDIHTGNAREVYAPRDRLGWPSSAPSGKHLAIVEAVCSDRWLVAGDLHLIEVDSGNIRRVDTHEVDITHTEWRSDGKLLLAGHRGFETVVGLYDATAQTFTELWKSREITAGRYIAVAGFNDGGDCVLVGEGFTRAPEIAAIRNGAYRTVKSFDLGYGEQAKVIGAAECVTWKAPDGLDIQGWLLLPSADNKQVQNKAPHPLVMHIHGGPVWQFHPMWLGGSFVHLLMLLKRGYAVFFPNPRGSSGRGQDFARRVVGDIGGADTYDYLSGLDALVAKGIADPERLGVTGSSYGGYMTSWLITQDARFAAAVAVVPATNRVSQRLISNHPHFVDLFVGDRYDNPGGKFFSRSPINYAHKAKTPTLNICGALDRCTPPGEAMQFHNALLANGVESVLVTYPQEGHGIRKFPAIVDYAARLVTWFEERIR